MYNRDYYFIRPIVLLYYSNSCRMCGSTQNDLHVHHINHNTLNNNFINLVPLCPDCHKLTHKLNIKHLPDLDHTNNEFKTKILEFLKSLNKL